MQKWIVAGLVCLTGLIGCESQSFLDPSEITGDKKVAMAYERPELLAGAARGEATTDAKPASKLSVPKSSEPQITRQVIYSAAFRIVVADVSGTLTSIRETAERLGGHLQQVSGQAITVRVPAAQFHSAVETIEKTGEVTERMINTADVTEDMQDLHIRLDNAEQLRKRLQALLEKAQKIEDTIRIESELARVTREVETLKGKIRYYESKIAFSTIEVQLNPPAIRYPYPQPQLPFHWVNDLGDGLVEGQVQSRVKRAGLFGKGPRFTPPPGFVRYFEKPGLTEAMDAEGLTLRIQQHKNVDRAGIDFWSKLIRKTLVDRRALSIGEEKAEKNLYVVRGARPVGKQTLGYLLAVKRNNDRLVVFEAWGPKELFDNQLNHLRASAATIQP